MDETVKGDAATLLQPPTSGNRFRRVVVDILLLNTVGALCVGLLLCLGGGDGSGLMPYYHEVARNSLSIASLIFYLACLCGYASAIELLLRGSQAWLEESVGAVSAVLLTAMLYGASHGKFSIGGMAYAFLLGSATSWFFYKTRRWKSLVLWHMIWELGAVTFVLLSAIFSVGQCRDALVIEYKLAQVKSGDLVFVSSWGWVDQRHCNPKEIAELRNSIWESRGSACTYERVACSECLFGAIYHTRYEYVISPPSDASLADCHAAAAGICLNLMERHELSQGKIGWLSGCGWSSFAQEDLSSTLFAAFVSRDALPCTAGWEIEPLQEAVRRWAKESSAFVRTKIRDVRQFRSVDSAVEPELARLLDRVEATSHWFELVGATSSQKSSESGDKLHPQARRVRFFSDSSRDGATAAN